jgi:hypothetical protein
MNEPRGLGGEMKVFACQVNKSRALTTMQFALSLFCQAYGQIVAILDGQVAQFGPAIGPIVAAG